MATDRSPLETAQRHEKKGNLAKAAEAYAEHLSRNPAEPRTLLKLAEIYERLGNAAAAADGFHRLGVMHAKDGIEAKATAVLRRALKLVPTHWASTQLLAEVLAGAGKKRDALDVLESATRAAASAGDARTRLKMLQRAAELDQGLATNLAFAEALADSGRTQDAITLLRQMSERLRHQDASLDRLQVLERLLRLSIADVNLGLEAAKLALEVRDHRRALKNLRLALDGDPDKVELIELAAVALDGMGEEARALLVYREAARRLAREGRALDAQKNWLSVLRLSPADPEARAAVPAAAGAPPPQPKPGPLAGIETHEMEVVLSAIKEHEFEVSLEELNEKLVIEVDKPGG